MASELENIPLKKVSESEIENSGEAKCQIWMGAINRAIDDGGLRKDNCEQFIDAYELVVKVLSYKSKDCNNRWSSDKLNGFRISITPFCQAIDLAVKLGNKMHGKRLDQEAKRIFKIIVDGLNENVGLAKYDYQKFWRHRLCYQTLSSNRFDENALGDAGLKESLVRLCSCMQKVWKATPGTKEELLAIARSVLMVVVRVEWERAKNSDNFVSNESTDFWLSMLWWGSQLGEAIDVNEKECRPYDISNRTINFVLTGIVEIFIAERDAEDATPTELLYLANICKKNAMLIMSIKGSVDEDVVINFERSLQYGEKVFCADIETIDACKAFLDRRFLRLPLGAKKTLLMKMEELEQLRDQGTVYSVDC